MGTVKRESDMQEQGDTLPLIRFLLQWDRRLANIAFGDGRVVPTNWRNLLFKETSRMTEATARGLASKMLDPERKLTPHEVFLFAFWTMLEAPERLYHDLLQQHRAKFFENIFGASQRAMSDEQGRRDGDVAQPLDWVDDESRVFHLRTRGRFLNAQDLKVGFERRFPAYRCLVESTGYRENRHDAASMNIGVLLDRPDPSGSHTLSAAAQAEVHGFLRETTSIYANVQAHFEWQFDGVDVDFEWVDGVNVGAAKARIESAFQQWTWTRWQFTPWNAMALENDVHAFLLEQKEIKNIQVRLGLPASPSGLMTLALNAQNHKEAS